MENSNLKESQKERFATKFDDYSQDFISLYWRLRDHSKQPCTFPPTWKVDDDEDDVDRYDRDDPCKAVSQMITGVSKWGNIFNKNCRNGAKGPYNAFNRILTRVTSIADRAKQRMECNTN